MFTRTTLIAFTLLFAAWTAVSPAAHASDWQFDANASAGAGYDSNVGIEDLDTNSGEADTVMELAAGGTIAFAPGDKPYSLRFGYDYSGTSHTRFEIFDLDLHHGFVAIEYRLSGFDTSLLVDRFAGVLDGTDYVSITQVSPSIARLFGERVYVRAAWIAATRDYDSLPARDARNSAVRVDTYLLLDNLDRYVSLGVQASDETASAGEFDYEGFQVALAYAHTFEFSRMRLKLKSSLRYENREYATTEVLFAGEPRSDQRWRAGLDAEVPFSGHVSMHASLEKTSNTSNFETVNLDKFLAGLELRVAF